MNKPSSTRSHQARRPAQAKPTRRSGATPADVVIHRLFPVLCAVWFAALFGLGCVVASADALASLVLHLHLPTVLPAAAPPLGMTARLLLGVMLAGLGGACGLVLGLFLRARAGGAAPLRRARASGEAEPEPAPVAVSVGAPRVRSRDAHPDAPPRRPLVVTEDVLPYPTTVGDPVTAPAFVPAPAPAPVSMVGETDFAARDAGYDGPGYDGSGDDGAEPDLPPFLAAAYNAASRGEAPMVIAPVEPVIVPADAGMREDEPVASETLADAPVEPVAPFAGTPPPLASLAATAPHVPLHAAPLDSLGLVQLIERLALAIATRQARRAPTSVAPAPIDAVDHLAPLHRFDPLTMDPQGPLLRAKPSKSAAFAMPESDAAAYHGASALLHDPLSGVADWAHADHHADHDADHGADLPPRFLGGAGDDHAPVEAHALTAGVVEDHNDAPDDAVAEERYSSLAQMTLRRPELMPSDLIAPVGHPLADGHSELAAPAGAAGDPVVPFPSRLPGDGGATRAAPVSDEADRALRDALATLRRMSAQR